MKGRKPKPRKLKLLAGNPGQRPLNDREPEPDGELGAPPEAMHPDAKSIWHELLESLGATGVLTSADRLVMESLCDVVSRLRALRQAPPDCIEKETLVRIENLERIARGYYAEIGLTPSSRCRVHGAPKREDDGKAKFFGSKGGA